MHFSPPFVDSSFPNQLLRILSLIAQQRISIEKSLIPRHQGNYAKGWGVRDPYLTVGSQPASGGTEILAPP